jgi:hypothetical protein
MRTSWWYAVSVLLLVGCRHGSDPKTAEGPGDEDLRKRAAFDMNCPNLEFVQISEQTVGVRGCGKQQVYVQQCNNPHIPWDCTWVLNSVQQQPAASPAPAAPAAN